MIHNKILNPVSFDVSIEIRPIINYKCYSKIGNKMYHNNKGIGTRTKDLLKIYLKREFDD